MIEKFLREDNTFPEEITLHQGITCLRDYFKYTDFTQFRRFVCCVCGEFFLSDVSKFQDFCYAIEFLAKHKHLLLQSNLHDVPIKFVDFNYESNYEALNGMVLDSLGFCDANVIICETCSSALKRNRLPERALANNLYTGKIPHELSDLTCVEESLIARCRVKCTIYKITQKSFGNTSQLKLCGNIITFPQNPDRILDLIPQKPEQDTFQIVFIGKVKPTNEQLKRLFTVRYTKVKNALEWLKKNNHLYKDVKINEQLLDELPQNDVPNFIAENISYVDREDDEDEEKEQQIGVELCTEPVLTDDSINNFECTAVIDNNESLNLGKIEKLNIFKKKITKNPILKVRHGDQPIQEWHNPLHLLMSYPCLINF